MKKLINQIRNSHDLIYRIVLFTLCLLAIVWTLPQSLSFAFEFEKGKPWLHEDLIAPFDFGVYKSKAELERDRSFAEENAKPYFNKVDSVSEQSMNKVVARLDSFPKEVKDQAISFLDSLYTKGIIQQHESILTKDKRYSVYVRTNLYPEFTELSELLNLTEARDLIQNKNFASEGEVDSSVKQILIQHLELNILYDERRSLKASQALLAEIPETYGSVLQDEKIIAKGELINNEVYLKLSSLKKAYSQRNIEFKSGWLLRISQGVTVLLAMLVMILFMGFFKKQQASSVNRFTFILLLYTLIVVLTSVLVSFSIDSVYLIPFCIVPILIRTFFDAKLAFFVHGMTILTIGYFAPNGFELVYIQMIAGSAVLLYLNQLRNRSQILLTILIIFLIYTVNYVALSVQHEGNLTDVEWFKLVYFAASSLFTLLIYPLIFVFEKTFGFLSEITLVELGDTNNKLLRDLSEKAPGTFQHSIQVANLAEKAAVKTHANPLLIRIGALYHDIGKTDQSEFFIENQVGHNNPHDELSNEQSAEIIINHVIVGIEKARKDSLPEEIIDFIRTHHGNTRVEYFYRNAVKDAKEGDRIDEKKYRYPGPKPFSKETAILMMADAIEASSRSLLEYTDESINELVERIINGQIEAEQFVNSSITFNDIRVIKALFKQMLKNIYHVRVAYPMAI